MVSPPPTTPVAPEWRRPCLSLNLGKRVLLFGRHKASEGTGLYTGCVNMSCVCVRDGDLRFAVVAAGCVYCAGPKKCRFTTEGERQHISPLVILDKSSTLFPKQFIPARIALGGPSALDS